MSIRGLLRDAVVRGIATRTNAPIFVDSADNKVKVVPAGSGSTAVEVLQRYVPVSVTAAGALTAAINSNRTTVVNILAGGTFTLPAATGSGNKYKLIVGTTLTSASLVLAVASASDYFRGSALLANDTDGSASNFETANTGTVGTESDTITFNRTTTGIGTIGDCIEVEDIATGVWSVLVRAQASGAEATPFSVAV